MYSNYCTANDRYSISCNLRCPWPSLRRIHVAAAAAANAAAAVAAALGVGGFGAAMVGGLHDGGMLPVEAALQGAATGSEEHRKCLILFAEIFRVI